MEPSISFEIPNARELATLNLEDYTKLLRNNGPDNHFPFSGDSLSSEAFGSNGRYPSASGQANTFHHPKVSAQTLEMPADYSLVVVSIWIIVIFGFFAVTIVFCVFSCMFYSKIRRWNQNGKHRLILQSYIHWICMDNHYPPYCAIRDVINERLMNGEFNEIIQVL